MNKSQFEEKAKIFTDLIIEKIKNVESNPEQGWFNKFKRKRNFFPQNLTGRQYQSGNAFLLMFYGMIKGYKTPIYLTLKQANYIKVKIIKGSNSFPVYYAKKYAKHKETNENISIEKYSELSAKEQSDYIIIPNFQYYNVFNLDQTNFSDIYPDKWDVLLKTYNEIIEFEDNTTQMYFEPNLEEMLLNQSWICPINLEPSNRAYFNRKDDIISLPEKIQFKSGEEFYVTLLHEMAHSTGIESRLNRKLGTFFGDNDYAREELVAELSSALMSLFFGFEAKVQDNNAAYIKDWMKEITDNPKFLLSILSDCMKVVKFTFEHLDIKLEKVEIMQDEFSEIER